MLPAWLQTPAALLLVVSGLVSCVAGYRVFRLILGIYGFILGALMASSFMGTDQALSMIVVALVGGAIGAAILVSAYFAGVALIGAGVGALVANAIWSSLGREPSLIVVVALSIAGALGALVVQRYVIVIATAFGGAWTAIVGGFALAGERAAGRGPGRNDVWLAYPFDPAPGQRWVIAAWLVAGVVGALVQLGVTAKGRK
ncbi:MAG: DUF4203 domain-containing protein [Vicinamibacterales bacterium]